MLKAIFFKTQSSNYITIQEACFNINIFIFAELLAQNFFQ
tara:strand:+ start:333 stop:452 length:120 start_codon:yes stop_codon:yes gene_type:complete